MTHICEDCTLTHYEPVSCPHCGATVCMDCYLERHEERCGARALSALTLRFELGRGGYMLRDITVLRGLT